MDSTTTVIVVAVVIVLLAAVLIARPILRRRRLQDRFGPEYERVVEHHENRSAAERELLDRERRHAELDIRPLSPEAHARYSQQWTDVQARFVDEPEAAVREADALLTTVMAERGYPTDGHDEQAALLSIDHSRTLDDYRSAHDTLAGVDAGDVSTENLREAMVKYRALFVELLETGDHDGEPVTRTDVETEQDQYIDERADGRFDGRTDGRLDGYSDGRVDGRVDGAIDGTVDGVADRTRHASR